MKNNEENIQNIQNVQNLSTEKMLELEIDSLCNYTSTYKIKNILDNLLKLSANLNNRITYYLSQLNKLDEKCKNEIHEICKIQHSFLRVIFYELFKETPKNYSGNNVNQISKEDIIYDLLKYSDYLSRLLMQLNNGSYQKYIIEMLFNVSKLLSIFSPGFLND